MKFSLKIEDLAGAALLVLAGLMIYVACAHAHPPPTKRSTSTHTLDLPMVTPSKGSSNAGTWGAQPRNCVPGQTNSRPEKCVGRGLRSSQLFKIGIIDTGYNKSLDKENVKICDEGSYDFGSDREGVGYTHFHGTAVAQTIASQLDSVNYCLVIYQVGSPLGISSAALAAALRKASTAGLIAVNISLEGYQYSFEERQDMYRVSSKGTAIFVAAGNRHLNLDTACMSYPGCYGLPNVYVVGATQDDGQYVANYSNFGSRVHVWKDGEIDFNGERMQGTSFASPRALGDYVHSLSSAAQ